MSTTSIDSTNNTAVSPGTDWHVGPIGAGYTTVEVANVDGAGSVSYKIAAGTNDVTSLGADHWVLPASAGVSRPHDAPADAFYVSVAVSATSHVLVTAW